MEQSELGYLYCLQLVRQLQSRIVATHHALRFWTDLLGRVADAANAAATWEEAEARVREQMTMPAGQVDAMRRQGDALATATPKEPWRDVERQPAPMPDGLSEAEADALERLATRVEKGEVKR